MSSEKTLAPRPRPVDDAPDRAGVREVLALTGPWLPVLSFLARLPAALAPTGTLIMVTAASGIGNASLAAGLLWVGQAVGGPLIGRIADRRGHRGALVAASLLNAAATAALVASVTTGQSLVVQALCSLAAGLTVPQIGPLSRARWVALIARTPGRQDERQLVARALSLDTLLDELGFMVGPALAGFLAVGIRPATGVAVAALLTGVAGTAFARHPSAPGPVRHSGSGSRSRLLSTPLLLLLALALLQGMVWGAANAGVNALARTLGDPGMAGPVWSSMAVTSCAAGLVVTVRRRTVRLTALLRVAVVAQAVLAVPLLAVHGFATAALAVAAVGVAVAPHLIAIFGLAETVAAADRMGEAMTVLGSGLIVGEGIAALLAGRLAATHGYPAALGTAWCASALAAVVALLFVRRARFDPPATPDAPGVAAVARGSGSVV
ncbi:MFS transporter [Streptacidiphilus fuscans]|uniref:MFS transporter n=1 Tax=Streptacidiphilus fuscans TaxID=2789292 RepID=A0A931B7R5_9ACTN|nr:MFS transporter [Streptacidiphilus fuscans]MBF9069398.1 MFS transporter [Streptacidiphilus fuscans]